jgi:hypothetical protein
VTWDGVPWIVDQASPDSSVLRTLARAAAPDGGIVQPTDLLVTALAAPGPSVQVAAGSCVIPNPVHLGEAYSALLASAEQADIAPTDASGPRSDLIVARIEDPNVDGQWAIPADPTVGPYVFTRVISGVPAGTTSIRDVRPGDSAITLARVDLPASTSSVLPAMVTDLRRMAHLRTQRSVLQLSGLWATPDNNGDITDTWQEFPLGATFNVQVPRWANHVVVEATWANLRKGDSLDSRGQLQATLGGNAITTIPYALNLPGHPTLTLVGEGSVAAAMRGTVQQLSLQGIGTASYANPIQAWMGTNVTVAVTWSQIPAVS